MRILLFLIIALTTHCLYAGNAALCCSTNHILKGSETDNAKGEEANTKDYTAEGKDSNSNYNKSKYEKANTKPLINIPKLNLKCIELRKAALKQKKELVKNISTEYSIEKIIIQLNDEYLPEISCYFSSVARRLNHLRTQKKCHREVALAIEEKLEHLRSKYPYNQNLEEAYNVCKQ